MAAGYNQVDMITANIKNNTAFYGNSERKYFDSLFSTSLNYHVFRCCWHCLSHLRTIVSLRKNNNPVKSGYPIKHALLIAYMSVLLLVYLGGGIRGEVGRNLICFMPFLAVLSASDVLFSRRTFLIHCIYLIIILFSFSIL